MVMTQMEFQALEWMHLIFWMDCCEYYGGFAGTKAGWSWWQTRRVWRVNQICTDLAQQPRVHKHVIGRRKNRKKSVDVQDPLNVALNPVLEPQIMNI